MRTRSPRAALQRPCPVALLPLQATELCLGDEAIATSNAFLIPTHHVSALIMDPGGCRVPDFYRCRRCVECSMAMVGTTYDILLGMVGLEWGRSQAARAAARACAS